MRSYQPSAFSYQQKVFRSAFYAPSFSGPQAQLGSQKKIPKLVILSAAKNLAVLK
jgi:hypothetical protein